MKFGRFYTLFVVLLFAAFAVVFNTFPRSVYSPLEKRELAQFPAFSWDRLQSGAFTRDVSAWFSDSEPFRDHFMTLSMEVKHRLALSTGEENITPPSRSRLPVAMLRSWISQRLSVPASVTETPMRP